MHGLTPILDLAASNGNKGISVTPGSSNVQARFQLAAGMPLRDKKNKWNHALALGVRVQITVDQPGATAAIDEDELYQMVESFRLHTPLLGTLIDSNHFKGTYAKHLCEFISNGYRKSSSERAQVPNSDSDTVCDLYFRIPIAQGWQEDREEDLALWLGHLEGGTFDVNIAPNTVFDSISTGCLTETCTVYAWLEYVPMKRLQIPPVAVWRRYEQAAAGGSAVMLQNVGGEGGLQGVREGCRLAGAFYLGSAVGFGGADTPDDINRINAPWREFHNIENPDALFQQYLKEIRAHYSATLHGSETTSGHPYGTGATVDNRLGDSEALFFPLITPNRKITRNQKARGNLVFDLGWGSAPSSGTHYVMTLELKEFTKTKIQEMLAVAGLNPNDVVVKRRIGKKLPVKQQDMVPMVVLDPSEVDDD